MKTFLLSIFTIIIMAINHTAIASPIKFEENIHYEVINEGAADKSLGLVEYFSFYCIACYRSEPLASSLSNAFPEKFSKSHIASMEPTTGAGMMITKAYALALQLELDKEISKQIYQRNFVERSMIETKQHLQDIFVAAGVAPDDFSKGMQSFGVQAQAQRWQNQAREADIRGTPTFVVNGKYKINPVSLRDAENFTDSMIDLANYLLEK